MVEKGYQVFVDDDDDDVDTEKDEGMVMLLLKMMMEMMEMMAKKKIDDAGDDDDDDGDTRVMVVLVIWPCSAEVPVEYMLHCHVSEKSDSLCTVSFQNLHFLKCHPTLHQPPSSLGLN